MRLIKFFDFRVDSVFNKVVFRGSELILKGVERVNTIHFIVSEEFMTIEEERGVDGEVRMHKIDAQQLFSHCRGQFATDFLKKGMASVFLTFHERVKIDDFKVGVCYKVKVKDHVLAELPVLCSFSRH